ncbi:hypothetical protein [Bacillus sp. FJAT-45066]|uniref:hypothetical protein n=1 Tax=Bacillus sp. FJAT-45066 TaxID=2011010 RepID=UPI0015964819|nr:hypothetical protein [Bacillus sp. FJAT-45066]
MEYLTKYLSSELGISTDIIHQILYSELDYYTELGSVVGEYESSDDLEETSVVYMEELIDFINNRTHIAKSIIETVLEGEDQYMNRLGLIEGF